MFNLFLYKHKGYLHMKLGQVCVILIVTNELNPDGVGDYDSDLLLDLRIATQIVFSIDELTLFEIEALNV